MEHTSAQRRRAHRRPAAARTTPRGVLYLLNGAGGGEDAANWTDRTDIVEVVENKNLYVVIPDEGAYTHYADWQQPDPVLGVHKWSTFLGEELPAAIDARYDTNGRNAIAGISSSATSALNLAIDHPDRFEAVGSHSGCAGVSDPIGQLNIRMVTEGRGKADTTNMWGPYDGPGWRANDPVLNAEKLRGTKLYISNASGLPGPYDTPQHIPDPVVLADQIVLGGGIEAVTNYCTLVLVNRLQQLGIPATVDLELTGTHSWLYWERQLHRSWSFFENALR